jgi:3',5'-cyclic AMP phosphodiesterase CpdA
MVGAAGAAVLAGVAGAEATKNVVGLALSQTFPETTSTLSVPDPSRIRVLQLTDIHFFCTPMLPNRDKQTQEDLPRLVDLTQPDLIMVTGDLWHDNPDGRGREYMEFAVDKIEKLGVPWTFNWGNHDQLDDYPAGHDYIARAKNSLYRGGASGGNYTLELQNKAGEGLWEMVLLNSSDRGLMDAQRQWLRDLAAARKDADRLPAWAVVHIPIQQFDTMRAEGHASGVSLEDVAYWDEDGTTFDVLKKAVDLKLYTCGHDHVNNYEGVFQGVDLVYGQATGTGGYGGNEVPKGAKLYTINAENRQYAWETWFPDGERWQVTDGLIIDDKLDVPWDTPSKLQAEKLRGSEA